MGEVPQGKGESCKEGQEVVAPSKSSRGKTSECSGVLSPSGEKEGGCKVELRHFIRIEKRKNAFQLPSFSAEICSKVLRSVSWQEAGTLLLYYPLADEVDVRPLIKEAHENGRRVLLPVVKGEDLELHLYEGEHSLREGAFGIMEPTGENFAEENYGEIRLALIPRMAFDRKGHRLGRGKGYYDRLLPKLKEARLQGICFPFQFLDEIPAEAHDISVHDVITLGTRPSDDRNRSF